MAHICHDNDTPDADSGQHTFRVTKDFGTGWNHIPIGYRGSTLASLIEDFLRGHAAEYGAEAVVFNHISDGGYTTLGLRQCAPGGISVIIHPPDNLAFRLQDLYIGYMVTSHRWPENPHLTAEGSTLQPTPDTEHNPLAIRFAEALHASLMLDRPKQP